MKKLVLAVSLIVGLVGCGDDDTGPVDRMPGADGGTATDGGSDPVDSGTSGLDPSRTIASLDMDEAALVCEDFIEAQGGPGTTADCGDGFELTVQTVSECAASIEAATCTNTLAEITACEEAIAGDACLVFSESACAFLADCVFGG
ncbi:MAG: hypothetical protein CMN30_02525 [Sandaracinus sp.]|nr:hypothetical protein [Sandaracinus sp.]|tara:strand:+ start:223 stop:660 length:438 start_codon:yes stop_codon:yes gene_type:complete